MDAISNSRLSGTLRNAKIASLMQLQTESQRKSEQIQASALNRVAARSSFQGAKENEEAFKNRSPITSRHQNTYLSPVKSIEKKIGANLDVGVTVFEYTKAATHNERIVVLSGKEHLSYPLSHKEIGEKTVVAAGPNEMYVFHRVPSEVSSDGSLINPENTAMHQLEHSELISNFASKPSLYVKTREGGVYLGSQISGEAALDAAEVVKFDTAKLDSSKRMKVEEAIVNLLKRSHTPEKSGQPGVSLGGINPKSIQFDNGEAKLLNSLTILPLDEEKVNMELNDAIATLRAYEGGSNPQAIKEARLRVAKKLYERSVVDRHAMDSGRKDLNKKPHVEVADRAETLWHHW